LARTAVLLEMDLDAMCKKGRMQVAHRNRITAEMTKSDKRALFRLPLLGCLSIGSRALLSLTAALLPISGRSRPWIWQSGRQKAPEGTQPGTEKAPQPSRC